MPKDYYEVLSVARGATEEEIKSAYRKLAMRCHPDRAQGDKAKEKLFKEASEAYAVLGNKEKRAQYDQFGHNAFRGRPQGFESMSDIFSAFSDIFGGSSGGGFASFGDMFAAAAGRGARSGMFSGGPFSHFSKGSRGSDLRYRLQLDLKEALVGAKKDISFHGDVRCGRCHGTGGKPGEKKETCRRCKGRGQIISQKGFFSLAVSCPQCHGEGKAYASLCQSCKGLGHVRKKRLLTVNIPPGAEHGTRLRLRGEGDPGSRSAGDLYVEIHLKPHERFEKKGQDLWSPLKVSYLQALLGARKKIRALEGEEDVTVPPLSAHGDKIRLPGLGLPSMKNPRRGDMICQIQVQPPGKLKKKEEELLRQIAELRQESVLQKKKGLF